MEGRPNLGVWHYLCYKFSRADFLFMCDVWISSFWHIRFTHFKKLVKPWKIEDSWNFILFSLENKNNIWFYLKVVASSTPGNKSCSPEVMARLLLTSTIKMVFTRLSSHTRLIVWDFSSSLYSAFSSTSFHMKMWSQQLRHSSSLVLVYVVLRHGSH